MIRYIKVINQYKKQIRNVLCDAGARYASIDINKCAKTKALLYNYRFIREFKKGFIEVLEELELIRVRGRKLNEYII